MSCIYPCPKLKNMQTTYSMWPNPLPDDKILDCSKLKQKSAIKMENKNHIG